MLHQIVFQASYHFCKKTILQIDSVEQQAMWASICIEGQQFQILLAGRWPGPSCARQGLSRAALNHHSGLPNKACNQASCRISGTTLKAWGADPIVHVRKQRNFKLEKNSLTGIPDFTDVSRQTWITRPNGWSLWTHAITGNVMFLHVMQCNYICM